MYRNRQGPKLAVAENISPDIVRIGTNVTVKLSYLDQEEEISGEFVEDPIKARGDFISKYSPLGRTIFNQAAGFIGKYKVNNQGFIAEVLEVKNPID